MEKKETLRTFGHDWPYVARRKLRISRFRGLEMMNFKISEIWG